MPMTMDKSNLRNTEVKIEGPIGNLNQTGGLPMSGLSEGDDGDSGFFEQKTGKKRSLTDDSAKKRDMIKGFIGGSHNSNSTKDTR